MHDCTALLEFSCDLITGEAEMCIRDSPIARSTWLASILPLEQALAAETANPRPSSFKMSSSESMPST